MEGDGKSTDVIAVVMDVTKSLEVLRKLLESQLQCSLEQFEIWLQDSLKVWFYCLSHGIFGDINFAGLSVCLFVCLYVCLSVCLSVRHASPPKLQNGFGWNFPQGRGSGLRPVMESIRRRREAIFGHVARMSPNIPAHQALRLQVEASLGRRPHRDWVRSSGRPRNHWIDQLCQNHQRPPADLWRAAIRRGHTGATIRSSMTTQWRRRRWHASVQDPASHILVGIVPGVLPGEPKMYRGGRYFVSSCILWITECV